MTGGGARGAYQAGALRALYEIARDNHSLDIFKNLVGISAGSINAAYIASRITELDEATERLCIMWKNLHTDNVFKSDYLSVSQTGFKLLRTLTLGGLSGKMRPKKLGLLDTKPLSRLISSNMDFNRIEHHSVEGNLESLCISAMDYSTSIGVTFYTGSRDIKDWRRHLRQSLRTPIYVDHIMGSTALPLFFPPWPVRGRYFGDGCLRNTAPLSPAIHIKADRVIVLGVRKIKEVSIEDSHNVTPSLGRILSVMISSVLMDSIENDIERIEFINRILKDQPNLGALKPIQLFYQTPSVTISDMAADYADQLPPLFRFLMGGLGSAKESSEILSYLTFIPSYCTRLVEQGYTDMVSRREALSQFLQG